MITARRAGAVAVALIAAQLVVRAVLVAWGDFYWDDLVLIGRASSHSIVSWDYLAHSHDGHFMPGAFLVAGVSTLIAPVQWWLPAATLVVLQAIASFSVWRMIRVIAPRQLGWGLAALAFYLLTPMTVAAFVWWAAGLNTLPMQAAMAIVVANAVILVRDRPDERRTRRLLIGAVVAFVVALLFFEKSLFIVPVAFVAALLVVRGGTHPAPEGDVDYRRSPLTQTFVRARTLWLILGGIFVAWTVLFLATSTATAGSHSIGQTFHLVWRTVNNAIVPSFVGGPWSWSRWTPSPPMGFPSVWMIVVGWLLLVAVVLVTVKVKRGAVAIWVCALGYAVGAQIPVMWNRSSENTALELAQTMRYLPDAALVLTIAFALLAAAPRDVGAHSADITARARPVAAVGMVGGVLVAVSALVATMAYGQSWRDDPTGDYLANARASLAQMDGKTMFDQPVPLEVLLPVAYPNNMISRVFGGLRKRPDFGNVTDDLQVLDPEGRLARGAVIGLRTFSPSRGSCARPRIDGPTELPLSGPLMDWKFTVGFSYCADRDGVVELRLEGGSPVEAPVRAGLHALYVQLEGHGTDLRIRPVTPGLRLHTGDGRVGEPAVAALVP
ncbi:hypothetical protein [Gordonia hydrophobica]|uniref:Transmembrane protein n=1 Tax=Gordonia hydrophobica TaxID=40516 RepID=A0ABZ2U3F9_9ACTN|nr:hypothetical protein [Gordonia hydrophobica]MBM7367444.1 hypothetical protein [Gordonia hydrophobica]